MKIIWMINNSKFTHVNLLKIFKNNIIRIVITAQSFTKKKR